MVQLRSSVPGGVQVSEFPGDLSVSSIGRWKENSAVCGPSHTILQWVAEQLVPEISPKGEPALDAAAFHHTDKALGLSQLQYHSISYSQMIHQSYTST